MVIGGIGYYSSTKNKRNLIWIYLISVSIISLLLLACFIGNLVLSSYIDEYILESWPTIHTNLDKAGIWLPKLAFINGL